MAGIIEDILKRVLQRKSLNRKEIYELLTLAHKEQLKKIFQTADRIRKKFVGDEVHLRGIVEFSNYCRNNCLYCGIRRDNRKVRRYRMPPEEIVNWVAFISNKLKYRTVVLQSGEDLWYTKEKLVKIIKEIKKRCKTAVVVSIGERNYETYKAMRKAGAERSLFRFETTNAVLYKKMTGRCLVQRIQHIKWMKELGYQVGTGPLIGLPGATIRDYVEDIIFLKKYNIDMAAMGPYICHPDTPLAGSPNGDVEFSLKMLAVVRLVCKDVHIPATTALQTLAPLDGRQRALSCGADIIMPNATPSKYRKYYLLYPNKVCIFEDPVACRQCSIRLIHSLGRKIGKGYGHSLRIQNSTPPQKLGAGQNL